MLQITASDSDLQQMARWVKAGNTPQSIALRSLIILEAHRGKSSKAIGRSLQVSQPTIRLWKRRFTTGGAQALTQVVAGRGRKPQLTRQKIAALIHATQQSRPAGQTHWSCRSMAKARGG